MILLQMLKAVGLCVLFIYQRHMRVQMKLLFVLLYINNMYIIVGLIPYTS